MKQFVLGVCLLGVGVCHGETYVIHTYGDPSLAQIAQAELNRGGGGIVYWYQDKLIIQASPADYARVSALVHKIDSAPTPLVVSVAIAHHMSGQHTGAQVNVGVSQRVWVNGRYQHSSSQHQSTNIYSAQTLSGSQVSLSSSTLLGLISANSHQYGSHHIISFGTTWLRLSDGFSATPKLLPNGQIMLTLDAKGDNGQRLSTSINLAKGAWTKVGTIAKTNTSRHVGFEFGQTNLQEQTPIWVKVD